MRDRIKAVGGRFEIVSGLAVHPRPPLPDIARARTCQPVLDYLLVALDGMDFVTSIVTGDDHIDTVVTTCVRSVSAT